MRIIPKEKTESASISAAEAYKIMERIKEEGSGRQNEASRSIMEYLKKLPMQRSAFWAESARKILTEGGLTDYEATLVINLLPERHTDAKALIPSLTHIENLTLDMLLNEIMDIPMKY